MQGPGGLVLNAYDNRQVCYNSMAKFVGGVGPNDCCASDMLQACERHMSDMHCAGMLQMCGRHATSACWQVPGVCQAQHSDEVFLAQCRSKLVHISPGRRSMPGQGSMHSAWDNCGASLWDGFAIII